MELLRTVASTSREYEVLYWVLQAMVIQLLSSIVQHADQQLATRRIIVLAQSPVAFLVKHMAFLVIECWHGAVLGPNSGVCISACLWADLNSRAPAAGSHSSVMQKEAAGSRQSGHTEGDSQYLTPTKSFSKKRVTACAEIVGAVHCSPEASLARGKGTLQAESVTVEGAVTCESSSDCLRGDSISAQAVAGDRSGADGCEESSQLGMVAELAEVCRRACEESKFEW